MNHQLNNLRVAVEKGSLLSVTSRLIGCGRDSNVVTMEEVWLSASDDSLAPETLVSCQ